MINLKKGEINTTNDEQVEKILEDLDNPLTPDEEVLAMLDEDPEDDEDLEDLDNDDFQLRIVE